MEIALKDHMMVETGIVLNRTKTSLMTMVYKNSIPIHDRLRVHLTCCFATCPSLWYNFLLEEAA